MSTKYDLTELAKLDAAVVTHIVGEHITILERAGSPVDSSWRLGAFLGMRFTSPKAKLVPELFFNIGQ